MKQSVKNKLETLLNFQKNYPTSHVGGSIGLMIRGINLQRDLSSSDLDITIDEFDESKDNGLVSRSDYNDFDYAYRKMHKDGSYTKIDIRVNPEPSFEVIELNGQNYNVSKLRDILFWKKKYANKGVSKHEYDLETIRTGIRPSENIDEFIF